MQTFRSAEAQLSFQALVASALLTLSMSHTGDGALQRRDFDPYRDSLPRDKPQAIYRPDPADTWNTVFYLLFTRTVEAALAGDGPQLFMPGDHRFVYGNRHVTRIESHGSLMLSTVSSIHDLCPPRQSS